jgi:hypothetical protein
MEKGQHITTTVIDDWAIAFNVKCSCEKGTIAVFYCNVESCPDHEQIYFCGDCVLIDEKHNHKRVKVKQELETKINDWKILVENASNLNQIIKQNYSNHHPLLKYLDNENLLKVDLSVIAPAYNVSEDVEKFDDFY